MSVEAIAIGVFIGLAIYGVSKLIVLLLIEGLA